MINPFGTRSQLNRTPESFNQTAILNNSNLESQQVQEELLNKINQITPNDTANIGQVLHWLKFSHPNSTSRKYHKEISTNNSPGTITINNLPNNNLPIQLTEMNSPTNKKVSLRDTL